MSEGTALNPFALRKAKIVYNFGLSECKRVKVNSLLGEATLFLSFLPSSSKGITSKGKEFAPLGANSFL